MCSSSSSCSSGSDSSSSSSSSSGSSSSNSKNVMMISTATAATKVLNEIDRFSKNRFIGTKLIIMKTNVPVSFIVVCLFFKGWGYYFV